MNLKEQLKQACKLTDADFSSHESDLYVKSTPEVKEWLKQNYEFYKSVQTFRSQIDGTIWLDIPFALFDEILIKRHQR